MHHTSLQREHVGSFKLPTSVTPLCVSSAEQLIDSTGTSPVAANLHRRLRGLDPHQLKALVEIWISAQIADETESVLLQVRKGVKQTIHDWSNSWGRLQLQLQG